MTLAAGAALILAGCGSSGTSADAGSEPPAGYSAPPNSSLADSALGAADCPDWLIEPPRGPDHFFAAATATGPDAAAARAVAEQICRDKFETVITANFRQLVAGVQFQRRLADGSELLARFNRALDDAPDRALESARISEESDFAEGDGWRACVLMELRRRAVDQAIYDVVVADDVLHAAAREGENFQTWEDYLQGKFD
jgi:hypothetical protein